ncbi:hypothetical protein [Lactobacillus gallinarum]|uniref:hypothetical protein n=1 Tax=Lactobacillus gallinarum TaxID=52242 RepID=UPI00248F17B8|nr:hypothetical protein [Lactobacillus gallinarum]
MPILYIFAGVNGARKSTLTQSQFNKVIPYEINADEISRRNGRDWQDICLLYVGLSSAELAIERVKIRVANGGHGVRKEMIKKRYDRSLNTLYELIRKFDSVSIYDNSGDSLIRIYQRIDNKHFMTSELPNWSRKIIAHDN